MPMPFKTKIAGIYLGVPHLPGTKIVHICSGDNVLVEVRACGPIDPAIVVNKMEGNAVLLESEWREMVQTIKDAIDLAKKI